MIMKLTASVFVLGCRIVTQISAIKPNCSCWVHICCQYCVFPNMKNIFAKRCAVFPRKQQVADVGIPVTRSLSGPITAWSPSAVNSMLSLWELMSRFRACPWASFGPATTKTTTARIPVGVWQYYMKIWQSSKSNCVFLINSSNQQCLEKEENKSLSFLKLKGIVRLFHWTLYYISVHTAVWGKSVVSEIFNPLQHLQLWTSM